MSVLANSKCFLVAGWEVNRALYLQTELLFMFCTDARPQKSHATFSTEENKCDFYFQKELPIDFPARFCEHEMKR